MQSANKIAFTNISIMEEQPTFLMVSCRHSGASFVFLAGYLWGSNNSWRCTSPCRKLCLVSTSVFCGKWFCKCWCRDSLDGQKRESVSKGIALMRFCSRCSIACGTCREFPKPKPFSWAYVASNHITRIASTKIECFDIRHAYMKQPPTGCKYAGQCHLKNSFASPTGLYAATSQPN